MSGLKVANGRALLEARVCTEELIQEFQERMVIDPTDINQCCIDQPAIMMEAVSGYEDALSEADAMKDSLAWAYANLDPQARNLLEAAGKVTEGKVDACIRTFPEYIELQEVYHAAKENAGRWRAIVEAAKNRKDMLVTIASNYRAEGSSDVSLRNFSTQSNQVLQSQVRAILNARSESE